jgi:hypothetical protein
LSVLKATLISFGIALCVLVGAAEARTTGHRVHSRSRAKPVRKAVAVPSAAARSHVETWAFDDGCNGGAGAGSALARQWLTYAESNCGAGGTTKALTDCHAGGIAYCNVMQYLDTDWDFTDPSVRVASASSDHWWLHEPSPNQGVSIFSSTAGGGNLINQANPAVRSFFRSYVRSHYNADDGLLMDWQSPSLAQELYYADCGCSSTSEIHSNAALRIAHEQMSASLTHVSGAPFVQVNNTLPPNPFLPQGLDMLNRSTGVVAWVAEGEPESGGVLDPYYSTLLDQIAYIANRSGDFVVPLSLGQAGASYQQQSRRVQEATVLLGYRPGHVVDWANLETGSTNLAVWPEEGIYPTDPRQSMRAPGGRGCLAGTGNVCPRGGHHNVQVAPGVYRREFRACYRGRIRFGGCAAVVNTTGSWLIVRSSWLRGAYRHQVTFNGGDVQSGGTVNLMGAPFTAGSTTVGPQDALLLTP